MKRYSTEIMKNDQTKFLEMILRNTQNGKITWTLSSEDTYKFILNTNELNLHTKCDKINFISYKINNYEGSFNIQPYDKELIIICQKIMSILKPETKTTTKTLAEISNIFEFQLLQPCKTCYRFDDHICKGSNDPDAVCPILFSFYKIH